MHFLRNSIGLHTNGQTLFPDQIITGRECLPYKKHAALGTSACATSSKTVCRIGLWRRHSCLPRPHACGRLPLGRRVESRMGASTDAERRPVSHPRSSNRTCRFPASGFPTGFTVDSRTRIQLDVAEPENSQLPEHRLATEAGGAARLHLMTPPQEMPYAVVHVIV